MISSLTEAATFTFKNATSIFAILGILTICVSLGKILHPALNFKVVSCYFTYSQDYKALIILKIQTTSNIDLTLEKLDVDVINTNGKSYKLIPFSVRWKGVMFVMNDFKHRQANWKLLKPLEPDLKIAGIKSGNNEYYIALKSDEIFEDVPISFWKFNIKWRQHTLFAPNIPVFDHRLLTVKQPEAIDLYFDDSLFTKITDEERSKILETL